MKIRSVIILVLVLALSVTASGKQPSKEIQDTGNSNFSLAPHPTTVDQITHNVGNILTTIDNYGYIGGYSIYDLPSGEWPRNSGHSYIAEMLYWMGGVTPSGDTLTANTGDDFEAIAMPNNGSNAYKIYLSTDTSRYYSYNPSDTVGMGTGSPAYGWRVWDPDNVIWDYNEVYNSLASSFNPAGPTSLQDSYYRFNDDALGSSLMGLEMTQRVLQWNYCYNEDFMYVILEITNTSTIDYSDFAFGLYVDLDVGGYTGTGENGRLEDQVVYDTSGGWAYIYDVQGYDPGWDAETGVMGTKFLETPNDVGMTAFITDDWAFLPDNDIDRYSDISSNDFDTPLPPTDQYYIQCSGGFDFNAGTTVRVTFAIVAGKDSAEFVDNANRAQELYDANYVGPEPPKTPQLTARASDGTIYLSWDNVAESSVDPLSDEEDFAGYKLYRSSNQGKTWGKVDEDNENSCMSLDYQTLATYRVLTAGDPIPHQFIDTGLYNGVEYWYCLSAYDKGDTIIGVDPLQTGFGIAGEAKNVIAATPRPNPVGFYDADATVVHEYTGSAEPSDSTVIPIIFDQSALTGEEYEVHFEESATTLYWHLINATNGDTILANQTTYNNDIEDAEINEGLTVLVSNPELVPKSIAQTSFGGFDTTLRVDHFYGALLPYWTGNEVHSFAPIKYRSDYEIRYTTDSTEAVSMWEGFDGTYYPRTMVPFEAWNTTTNQRVWIGMDEWPIDGQYEPGDALFIMEVPYDPLLEPTDQAFPYYYGWRFTLDSNSLNASSGDVLTIEGTGQHGPDDVFSFTLSGVDANLASNSLKNIKVVPNPYLARYSSMVETNGSESVIEFQHIPDECTIRIYTLSGELVETITHNDIDGVARWNLLSDNSQQVASGIYLYHVESPYGDHLGRFAIIK